MRTVTVINNIHTAWNEVSLSWKDTISQKFHTSVLDELESILQSLNSVCEKIDRETDNVNNKLKYYEAL
jgi:hypothetical protein